MTRATAWLLAFVWTNALELPIYTLMLQRRFERWWSVVALTVAINALTHPLLWFVFPRVQPFWVFALAGESGVVIVETVAIALVLRRTARPQHAFAVAALAALVANVCSFAVGGIVVHALT